MQLCRLIYYSLSALYVSGDFFAHHQEHLNAFTASGIIHQCRCRLVSWMSWNSMRSCKYSQVLLMMGENIVRNMYRWQGIMN